MRRFILFVVGVNMLANPLIANKKPMPLSPLQKISLSFSDDKLGRATMPKGAKLMDNALNNSECSPKKLADCYVRDVNGVELYFSPYDGLNSKTIAFSADYNGPVNVLSIGTARSRAGVLAAIIRFVPGLKFDCTHYELVGGVKERDLHCSAPIPDKWGAKTISDDPSTVQLLFNENNRIKSAAVWHSSYID